MNFLLNERAECVETVINNTSTVTVIHKISEGDFISVCSRIENEGYILKENNSLPFHKFKAYHKGTTGAFVNYFPGADEITVCFEEECNYFSYSDRESEKRVSPQIAQLYLEDFGMSYVIRLSDSRFIIIDGGWDLTPDAERLYAYLKENTADEKPVVAAWIITHMHTDHYRCFNRFTELHKDDVTVEKFLINFPSANKDNFEGEKSFFRAEIKEEYPLINTSDKVHVARMFENMKLYGAKIYMPHTGQKFRIGDSLWECLSCVDDSYHFSEDDNSSSLVFRMELAGQVVLWTADASFSDSGMLKKYGNYLKADILQVPHHGFMSGDAKEHKLCYDLIDAEVCLLPVSSYNAYVTMDTYIEASGYLMKNTSIKELIDGDETVTLTLPYHAPAYAREAFKSKFYEGRKAAGSKVWIYSGLDSSEKDDFVFDIFNGTRLEIKVSVELFFSDSTQRTTGTAIMVPPYSVNTYNLRDGESVTLNKCHFNWESVNVRGIPENTVFAVRFIAENGIVVSHKTRKAAYNA